MNKIEEMMQELCPYGVDYKTIGECIEKTNKIKWMNDTGIYSYIDLSSVDRETHKIADTSTINADNAPSRAQQIVLAGDILFGTTRPTLKRYCVIDSKYHGQICSTGFCVLRAKENVILPSWLFYIISSTEFSNYVEMNQKGASYPAISDKEVKQFKMPVPPLEIQHEIVRILDGFTQKKEELKIKLQDELIARKKQYEYYSNKLLAFNGHVQYKKLGDIFEFRNGLSKGKEFFGRGTPFIRYTDVYNHRALYRKDITALVECTPSELIKLKVSRGDVMFTRTSETAEDVGWSSVMLDDIAECVFNGFTIKATPKTDDLLPEYCAYCFSTEEFRRYVTKNCTFTTRASLTGATIADFEIAVPDHSVQFQIVRMLDNFKANCSELNRGILAEIEAREKQYEYYRDNLLNFKERLYE